MITYFGICNEFLYKFLFMEIGNSDIHIICNLKLQWKAENYKEGMKFVTEV